MLKTIFWKDITLLLKDFKFQVLLLIMFILFVICSFNGASREKATDSYYQQLISQCKQDSADNNSSMQHLIRVGQVYFFENIYKSAYITVKPGFPTGLMTELETFRPQKYDISYPSKTFFRLDWAFIFGILGSLMCLLISYDVISNEKQNGTFRLVIVEGVTRFQVLFSKFLSTLIIVILAILPGFVISTILMMALTSNFSSSILITNVLTLLLFIPYFCFFIILGILISMSRNYRNSIIITMTVWLLFIIIIPQGANIVAKKLLPVKSQSVYDKELTDAKGKVYTYWRDKAFTPDGFNTVDGNMHLENGMRVKGFYESNLALSKEYNKQNEDFYRQIEMKQKIASISPMGLMDNMMDILLDIGYYHFKNSLSQFEQRYNEIKQDIVSQDKADPNSMHFYYANAEGDAGMIEKSLFSMKPYNHINRLVMMDYRQDNAVKKFHIILPYLLILILINALVWVIVYFKIIHFDVR